MSDLSKRVNELDADMGAVSRLLIRIDRRTEQLDTRQGDIIQELNRVADDVKSAKAELGSVGEKVAAILAILERDEDGKS